MESSRNYLEWIIHMSLSDEWRGIPHFGLYSPKPIIFGVWLQGEFMSTSANLTELIYINRPLLCMDKAKGIPQLSRTFSSSVNNRHSDLSSMTVSSMIRLQALQITSSPCHRRSRYLFIRGTGLRIHSSNRLLQSQ